MCDGPTFRCPKRKARGRSGFGTRFEAAIGDQINTQIINIWRDSVDVLLRAAIAGKDDIAATGSVDMILTIADKHQIEAAKCPYVVIPVTGQNNIRTAKRINLVVAVAG